jgi:periplasmic protein TonB
MWDESLIESQRKSQPKKALFLLTVSIALHLAVAISIVISYFSYVEPVEASFIPITFLTSVPPPPPPPPAARKKSDAKIVAKAPLEQPTEIPEKIEDDPPPSDPSSGEQSDVDLPGVEGGIGDSDGQGLLGETASSMANMPAGFFSGGASTFGEAAPLQVSGKVVRPLRTKTVRPVYPDAAQRAHIEGIVWLQLIISETGRIESVVVTRSLHPILDQCAIDAAQQWKYRPALLNRHPVRVVVNVAVRFSVSRVIAGF